MKDKKFSWERPREQRILEFVQSLANQMENVEINGQKEVREGAGNYAKAYRTIESFILKLLKE
jgi:hypothetical protein